MSLQQLVDLDNEWLLLNNTGGDKRNRKRRLVGLDLVRIEEESADSSAESWLLQC
jgi:hypothetical protein